MNSIPLLKMKGFVETFITNINPAIHGITKIKL